MPRGEETTRQDPEDRELLRQLAAQLDDLVTRVRAIAPDYEPPPFSPRRLVGLIEERLGGLPKDLQLGILDRLRKAVSEEWLNLETWKGLWFMLNYTLQYNAGLVKRRFIGEYDTDDWGLDRELLDALMPLMTFFYKIYWRVGTTGIEYVPIEGGALLVANTSGMLPWDSLMVMAALLTEHPAQRLVRTLHAEWLAQLPFLSSMLVKLGQAVATEDNGVRLLAEGELVAVYPERDAGIAKTVRNRYQVGRFGQGEFVRMALRAGVPIMPVAIVGAEDAYPRLGNAPLLARATGLPAFPITPAFPALGLLGLVPMPTKWTIEFGQLIATDGYVGGAADNPVLVSQLADQVRHAVQEMIHARLSKRRTAFLG